MMDEAIPSEESFRARMRGLVGAGTPGDVTLLVPAQLIGISAQSVWRFGDTVYLIQEGDSGPTKIGIAAHPFRRFESIQCGNPRSLFLRSIYVGSRRDCIATEKTVLRHFGEYRSREWLHVPYGRIVAYLESIGTKSF